VDVSVVRGGSSHAVRFVGGLSRGIERALPFILSEGIIENLGAALEPREESWLAVERAVRIEVARANELATRQLSA